jgi:hypothetical protein
MPACPSRDCRGYEPSRALPRAGNYTLADGRGAFRIEGVWADPDDPKITLYGLAVWDGSAATLDLIWKVSKL